MKSVHPLISIITPTFNSGQFISAAMQSVVDQTYSNWELLVVDDGSRDDTMAIIDRFAEVDSRIRSYAMTTNSGRPAVPRNYAIRLAKGELITFLDADDIWLPRKIERQATLMVNRHDIALAYVLNSRLYPNGRTTGPYPAPKHRIKGYAYEKLYLHNSIANSGVMVRKSIFDTVGLLDEDPKLAFVEDADMWLRIARKHPVDYVPGEVLLLYRVKQNRLSAKQSVLKMRGRMRIAKKHYAHAGMILFIWKILTMPLNEGFMKRISI